MKAVREIARNPALLAERGAAARIHLAPYPHENAERELPSIYRAVLDGSGVTDARRPERADAACGTSLSYG